MLVNALKRALLGLGFILTLKGCVTAPQPKPTIKPSYRASTALLERGKLLMRQKRLTEAALKFERALALDPSHGEVYFHLASLKLKERAPLEAIGFAKRGLSFADLTNQEKFQFYVILSVSHRRLGNPKESALYAQKAEAHKKKMVN